MTGCFILEITPSNHTSAKIMTHSCFCFLMCNVPGHRWRIECVAYRQKIIQSPWSTQFLCHAYLSLNKPLTVTGVCACDGGETSDCVCVIYNTGAAYGGNLSAWEIQRRRTESKNTTAEWAELKKKKQWLSPLSSLPLGLQAARCCLRMKYKALYKQTETNPSETRQLI